MHTLTDIVFVLAMAIALAATVVALVLARHVRSTGWLALGGGLAALWAWWLHTPTPTLTTATATVVLSLLGVLSIYVLLQTRRPTQPNYSLALPAVGVLGTAGIVWAWPTAPVVQGVVVVAALSVGAALLWATFHANHRVAVRLRGPVLLLTVPLALSGVWAEALLAWAAAPLALAVGWCAVLALNHHIQSCTDALSHELRVADGDLKRALAELAHERAQNSALRQELRQAIAYKSQFLAIMSHELRTPLNAIVGYSELLRDGVYGPLTTHQDDRLRKIHRNGTHLLRVISDILDLNKIEAGRLEMRSEEVVVPVLVHEITAEASTDCAAKGLALNVTVDEPLPPLYGDNARLQQVLRHLLNNAVKFTERGHIHVVARSLQVRGGRADSLVLPTLGWLADGAWVLLSVSDTGIGIAPEHQAIIFDEFAQADLGSARVFDGTGLGLAIARKLTALHGGTLWVHSRGLGHGSAFHVALPADKQPIAALHAVAREDVLR